MTGPGEQGRPLVLVTVGSDHHPFDRLVTWVDAWLTTQAGQGVDCVMQYGTARPPSHARGSATLPHAELLELMARATVVVSQGGPLSLVEVRRHGGVPIAVPRSRALGEVVDDHQHAFCRFLQEQGRVELALDQPGLHALLDQAVADPSHYRVGTVDDGQVVRESIDRFVQLADEVIARQRTSGLAPRWWRGRPSSRRG